MSSEVKCQDGTMGLMFFLAPGLDGKDGEDGKEKLFFLALKRARKETITVEETEGEETKKVEVTKYGDFHSLAGPGGKRDGNEDIETTMKREFEEETGCEARIVRPLAIYRDKMHSRKEYDCHVFLVLPKHDLEKLGNIEDEEKLKNHGYEPMVWEETYEQIKAALDNGRSILEDRLQIGPVAENRFAFISLVNLVEKRPELGSAKAIVDMYERSGEKVPVLDRAFVEKCRS
ncbi:hypothetical protein PWT90_07809 [Aphanocladium album]|nr:hypothetical protein PWT90_07809 [Aphanocladium album]